MERNVLAMKTIKLASLNRFLTDEIPSWRLEVLQWTAFTKFEQVPEMINPSFSEIWKHIWSWFIFTLPDQVISWSGSVFESLLCFLSVQLSVIPSVTEQDKGHLDMVESLVDINKYLFFVKKTLGQAIITGKIIGGQQKSDG